MTDYDYIYFQHVFEKEVHRIYNEQQESAERLAKEEEVKFCNLINATRYVC